MRMDTSLEEIVRRDQRYQDADREAKRKERALLKLALDEEQWLTVDGAMSACNLRSAAYGKLAYAQGFADAIRLVKEMIRL